MKIVHKDFFSKKTNTKSLENFLQYSADLFDNLPELSLKLQVNLMELLYKKGLLDEKEVISLLVKSSIFNEGEIIGIEE